MVTGRFSHAFCKTTDDFVYVKAFQLSVFFANHELDGFEVFVGGVAFAAVDAFFSAARGVLYGVACFKGF